MSHGPGERGEAQELRRAAERRAEVEQIRAELVRLRLELSDGYQEYAKDREDRGARAIQLLDASEALTMAVFRADEVAEAAVSRLDQVIRSGVAREEGAAAEAAAAATAHSPSSPLRGREAKDGAAQGWARDLVDANEHLVLSALAAQEASADATAANVQQVESMARVAHEMRSPMNPLQHAVELLCRPGVDPKKLPVLQGIVERQIGSLQRLIQDLLDGARASCGELHVRRVDTSMAALLRQVVEDQRPSMSAKRQKLTVRIPRDPLQLYGDPVRLAQVFRNLLDNASKFSPVGGSVELTAELGAEASPEPGAEQRGDTVVISLSDDGIGMSAEDLDSVFRLFWQSPRVATSSAHGLGVGLSVSRSIVEAHGGSLVATSPGEGKGCTFVVTLPMTEPAGAD